MISNIPGYWFIKENLNFCKKNQFKYKWNGFIIQHRNTMPDLGVIDQILIKKDYDLSKLARFSDIINFYEKCSTPLIIDAGANIGVSTIWFKHTFPKSKIVAIEPQSSNFSLLSLNTKDLSIVPIQGALSNACGTANVFDPGHGEWGFRTGQNSGNFVEEVSAYDINSLIDINSTPFILKIDIEGAESEVFADNTKLFHRFPLIIIELHDWMLPKSSSSRSFLSWHSTQNRDFLYINENVFSISNEITFSEIY